MQIKENKQLNIQQKQNYPGSVASYDTQPGNEVGLFYNGPEHHTGQGPWSTMTCYRILRHCRIGNSTETLLPHLLMFES